MASFVERTVDVIGADPNVPDSVFRELFSSVGDIAWVTRWSSAGQKHHAFLCFKSTQMASKALSLQIPRTANRDWRLSRLNPDLKARVVDLLPKFIQSKVRAEEALIASRQPQQPASTGGPSSATGSNNGPDTWVPPRSDPSLDGWQQPIHDPERSWIPAWHSEPVASYGPGGSSAPMPWSTATAPVGMPQDVSMAGPDAFMLDHNARPLSRASNRPDFAEVASQSGARPPSPPSNRWGRDANRPASPTSPHSFRSLPPKPNTNGGDSRSFNSRYPARGAASADPRDRPRDGDRFPGRRLTPPPGPRGAARIPSPVRTSERDQRNVPRRDSRQDDRGRDFWARTGREPVRSRSRSRSPDGGRSRSPANSTRDLRAPPHGRDPRANDFRRPRDQNRAMSPGQLSSTTVMDRAYSLNGFLPSTRSQSPPPMDTKALCVALSSENAPISSWMEVVSRYRRRNELDAADQAAIAAIDHFKKSQPNSLDLAKPFHLVLANTHNTRARQLPPNSEEANSWQAKASEWIRQAQALGASGDENPAHDATDGLAWLQKHMLDQSLPRDVISPMSPGRAHDGALTSHRSGLDSADGQPLAEYTAKIDQLQSKHQYAVSQLRAEQATRKRLEERVKSLEGLLRATETKLVAAEARSRSSGGSGSAGEGSESDQLRRAEAEKTRLLGIITEERISKRRAEDAEQEERAIRRKLEDQLWMLGASIDPPAL